MVPFVVCFGVEFLCCLNLMNVFIFLFKFGKLAYLEIAAHSAYDICSMYKCLTVNLGFNHLGFWSGDFFLIAPFPDHCLLVPFYNSIFPIYDHLIISIMW